MNINIILFILFLFILIYLIYSLIPILKNKIGSDKLEVLESYTEYAVRTAEQLYTSAQNKEKKEFVLSFAKGLADRLNVPINPVELDVLIEGIVNLVKH